MGKRKKRLNVVHSAIEGIENNGKKRNFPGGL